MALKKFQSVGFQSWKGLTKDNHLGAAFLKAPQKATNLMVQLLAYHRGKTLDTFLSQFPTRQFESDDEYTWNDCKSYINSCAATIKQCIEYSLEKRFS